MILCILYILDEEPKTLAHFPTEILGLTVSDWPKKKRKKKKESKGSKAKKAKAKG